MKASHTYITYIIEPNTSSSNHNESSNRYERIHEHTQNRHTTVNGPLHHSIYSCLSVCVCLCFISIIIFIQAYMCQSVPLEGNCSRSFSLFISTLFSNQPTSSIDLLDQSTPEIEIVQSLISIGSLSLFFPLFHMFGKFNHILLLYIPFHSNRNR